MIPSIGSVRDAAAAAGQVLRWSQLGSVARQGIIVPAQCSSGLQSGCTLDALASYDPST